MYPSWGIIRSRVGGYASNVFYVRRRDRSRTRALFYGAIFAPANSMPLLRTQMEQARKEAGLANTDSLKFASSTPPKGMTFEAHRDLKKTVLSLAREVGNVTFCAQATLHELTRNKDHDDLVLWGANTVLSKFNMFLDGNKSHGYAVLDKISVEHPYRYLKEKFQVGLKFSLNKSIRLQRIFENFIKKRPRVRLTIRQRSRVLQEWPPP